MSLDRSAREIFTALFAAPLEPEQWNTFLALISQLCGTNKAALIAHDFDNKDHRIGAVFGDSVKESVDLYERHYWQFDEWSSRWSRMVNTSGLFIGEQVWSVEEMQKSVFYNEFLKPFDVCQVTGFIATSSAGIYEALSIYRGPREAPLDREQNAVLQMFAPHLQAALALRRRLLALESKVSDLETALDQLGTGVVLLDSTGRPIFVNREARRICDQRDGVYLSSFRLAAEDAGENRRLRDIIAKAISAGRNQSMEYGGVVAISRTHKSPLQILAAPFISHAPDKPRGAVAIVFITAELKSTMPAEILRNLYGLTPAEARLALSLLDGNSLKEIAESTGVGHETVRSQVKSALHKTGTKRQGELIRLLSALPRRLP